LLYSWKRFENSISQLFTERKLVDVLVPGSSGKEC
jgi:hypothetical protein